MRIVMDLQGAQTALRVGRVGRHVLEFARSVARNRGRHEVVLALNGAFPDTIEAIRAEFDGLLPQENILVWRTPSVRGGEPAVDGGLRNVGEMIREAFFASLGADVVHIGSLPGEGADDYVASIGRFDTTVPVSVSLFACPESGSTNHLDRQQFLTRARHLFVPWDICGRAWTQHLGVPDSVCIKNAAPVDTRYYFASPFTAQASKLRRDYGISRPFVVCSDVSPDGWRRAVQAFAALPASLRASHQLLLTGGLSVEDESYIRLQAKSLGLEQEALCLACDLDEADLGGIYRLCRLRVIPGNVPEEQSGALESIACGAPTLGIPGVFDQLDGMDGALVEHDDMEALSAQMARILQDDGLRSRLRECGLAYAQALSWDGAARQAIAAWESMGAGNTPKMSPDEVLSKLVLSIASQSEALPEELLCQVAASIATALPTTQATKRIFVDVSEIRRNDLKTGIQRVVRSWLLALLAAPIPGYQVEPVYLCDEKGRWICRYAQDYKRTLVAGLAQEANEIIDPIPGDVWLGMDLTGGLAVEAEHAGLFKDYRNRGVAVYTTVYDLLPVRMPEMFPEGSESAFRRWLQAVAHFDGAVCISKAVADDLAAWRDAAGFDDRDRRPYRISWAHLGADVMGSAPTMGLPDGAESVLNTLRERPSFLMVGTLEPRKGYTQVLDAFEHIWNGGGQVNLVLVGKQGWKVDDLIVRLALHPERGRRLFWLEGASDEYLEKIYAASRCLIAASCGEGFGLPLIEAAHHKLPILARDIPVFREVAGEHAYYFDTNDGIGLAAVIGKWLTADAVSVAPSSEDMPFLSWKESAQCLMDFLLGRPSANSLRR